jgi:type I restriction enzyme R subunit
MTRKTLLEKLDQAGFGKDELSSLQKLIDAEEATCLTFWYVFNSEINLLTREARVAAAQATIFA